MARARYECDLIINPLLYMTDSIFLGGGLGMFS